MKFFCKSKDGGPKSTVWAYWLCEIKSLFSIALLKFVGKSREAYHDHAFNCISWVIKGELFEQNYDGTTKTYKPSIWPILTYRETFHKVDSKGTTWVLTFRGSWRKHWHEFSPANNQTVKLADGRKIVEKTP